MHKKIIFRHGLGLSNQFWNQLLPFFHKYDCSLLDENYFNNNIKETRTERSNVYVGIGHSLGFFKLCEEFPEAKYLIGINAFTNFLGQNAILYTARCSEHEIFKQSFNNKPKKTLERFYKRCGIASNETDLSYINAEKIKTDLNLLAQKTKLPDDKKILIINSMDDQVVPTSITEDNFSNSKATIHYVQHGKHSLGFLHAEEISKIILDFII
jgi:pimeloyl-[acyl-carrier protein] methyl ester esterase